MEIGDLIAVPHRDGGWGCLQVTDLKRSGPTSRKAFIAGALDWRGAREPEAVTVNGSWVAEQALVRIDIFTRGGYLITGNCPVGPNPWTSNFRDSGVGTVHHVWAWGAAALKAGAARDDVEWRIVAAETGIDDGV